MQIFDLDISIKRVIPLLYVKQRDAGKKILVNITNNGDAYAVPANASFSVWFSGKSGEGNYTAIGDKNAFTIKGNAVTVELIVQMLNCPGEHVMCLVMNGVDGTQLGLWNIPYYVEAIPGADSEAATEYYSAFLETQKKATDAAGRAEEAAEQLEGALLIRKGEGKSSIVRVFPDLPVGDEAAPTAKGEGAVSLGKRCHAPGKHAFAVNYSNTAEGEKSFVSGSSNKATGFCDSSFGYLNTNNGEICHTSGYNNEIPDGNSQYCTIGGCSSKTTGKSYCSIGHGDGLLVEGFDEDTEGFGCQAVFGRYNVPNKDAVLILGSGTTDENRSNALEVLRDGTIVAGGDINPLMKENVEYRTANRFNGKVVYEKYIDLGKLPESGEKSIQYYTPTEGAVNFWFEAYVKSASDKIYPIPFFNTDGKLRAIAYATKNSIVLVAQGEATNGHTAFAIVHYTKD